MTPQRATLGDFMSLTCFQYLRVGTEEVADRAPIVAAGRKRGFDVATGLSLSQYANDLELLQAQLDAALGENGTRLCLIQSISATPTGYEVRITEGACATGQIATEPMCAFTMGVFVGVFQGVSGKRIQATETACCACNAPECVYKLDVL